MFCSALWVCLSVEDSWHIAGTAFSRLSSETKDRQRQEFNKIHTASRGANTFLLFCTVKSFCCLVNTFQETRSSWSVILGKNGHLHAPSIFKVFPNVLPNCEVCYNHHQTGSFDALLCYLLKHGASKLGRNKVNHCPKRLQQMLTCWATIRTRSSIRRWSRQKLIPS